MNVGRLRELADLLLKVEGQFKIQEKLQNLINKIQEIINNPNHSPSQTQYAQAFTQLSESWTALSSAFTPAQISLLEEIGARPYFFDDIPGEIDQVTRENPITPAVTQNKIQQLFNARNQYLTTITELRDRLKALKIEPYDIEPNSAEIGLLIPRDLFHNKFDQLIKELGTINRILRTLSEIATGSAEPIEVQQISTSDPVFILGLSVTTIVMVGNVIKWAIQTWKDVEDIRKVRSETQKLKSFTPEEIESIFESKIKKTIDIAIEEKVTELMGPLNQKPGRHQELRNDLPWVLESILTRVERGVTVEIRFLPPPITKDADGKEILPPAEFNELQQIVPQLKFPAPEATPIFPLPPPQPPSEQNLK